MNEGLETGIQIVQLVPTQLIFGYELRDVLVEQGWVSLVYVVAEVQLQLRLPG